MIDHDISIQLGEVRVLLYQNYWENSINLEQTAYTEKKNGAKTDVCKSITQFPMHCIDSTKRKETLDKSKYSNLHWLHQKKGDTWQIQALKLALTPPKERRHLTNPSTQKPGDYSANGNCTLGFVQIFSFTNDIII